jgi:COPII coat assembly protein SEC16
MITMIPRTPHRVNIRNTAPLMVPGPITFSSLRDIVEPPGLAASFPGPLFSGTKPINAKSKDLGNWLESNLAMLEQLRESHSVNEDDIIRIEDRKVLLKLIKLLVDNNGVLNGR